MKKQSTLKRALALGMSATMVSATLAGCGGSASSTAATSTETASSATTEAEATTDSDKPFAGTTLTWYTTLNGNVSDNFANLGDTPWAKYVEEQTGITIEFQHPTQGSEAEEFAVMLASGEYPDIIEYTWTTYSGGAGAAINDGVIISLDDYMADATNLSKVMQEHPEIGKMIKSSGGNYYCFPCLRGLESPNKTEFSSGFLYRADALKELGFDQVPETIDEWEEVLRAAKAAGYSKPFTTRKEWVKDVWSAAYDNWGSFYVDDGVVKNGLIEDSRKDFIQKMADWYAEGLLDIRLQGGFILLVEGILLGKWFRRILQPNRFIGVARLQIMSCCCINFAFGTKLCNLVAELHFFALICTDLFIKVSS